MTKDKLCRKDQQERVEAAACSMELLEKADSGHQDPVSHWMADVEYIAVESLSSAELKKRAAPDQSGPPLQGLVALQLWFLFPSGMGYFSRTAASVAVDVLWQVS